jgi:hypothetical protein
MWFNLSALRVVRDNAIDFLCSYVNENRAGIAAVLVTAAVLFVPFVMSSASH